MKIITKLGYGTAYEKVLLLNHAKGWIDKYNINSVLEYPANDLMDNNNEIFEKILGTKSCNRLKRGEKTDKKYDLVWCFCEFENDKDSEKFIQDMINKSNCYVLIITQNYKNLGVPIHALWHILLRRRWNHGMIHKFSSAYVKKFIKNDNILEIGAFDCPWFYFDIYETLFDIKSLLGKGIEGSEKEFYVEESIFERLPTYIKTSICHHNHLIFKVL